MEVVVVGDRDVVLVVPLGKEEGIGVVGIEGNNFALNAVGGLDSAWILRDL